MKLLKVVWEKGVAPTGWKTAIIVPIHNKGKAGWSVTTIGNQLIECCWECFARVLNDRVKDLMAGCVMDEQGGFRSGRGCIDQVFAVKQVIEKMIEKDN